MLPVQSFEFALRLSELIGSGRSSVNHTRHLAEIYDSNLVTLLAKNQKASIRVPFISNPSKASAMKYLVTMGLTDCQTFEFSGDPCQTTSVQPMRIICVSLRVL